MRSFHVVPRALFAASVLGLAMAFASQASAAVYSERQALSPQTVQQFISDPTSLLSQFPNGGPMMITKVRDLAASDPATLSALMGLLKTANPDQSTAIGTALGQVALMAINTDQAFATEIQTQIAQAGNASALVAFSAVVGGDIKLTAAGPGVGIGGGGESQTQTTSGIGGFFAGAPLTLPTSAPNTPDTFTLLSFSPGVASTSSGTSISPY
jgi:hypothetical protein